MKKLLLISLMLFSAHFANAAVALISATNMGASNTADVNTTSGSNRVMVVNIGGDVSDNTTAVSVGSDSLTFMVKRQVSGNRWHYQYCGILTVTGTQTVTITGGSLALSTAQLYSGAGACKNATSATGNSGAPSVSITAASDSWLAGGVGNDAAAAVAGANTTCRSQGGVCTSSIQQDDSNGVASPISLNWTIAPSGNWAAYGSELPVAVSAAAPIPSILKLLMGMVQWW